jgi:adenylate cyclase
MGGSRHRQVMDPPGEGSPQAVLADAVARTLRQEAQCNENRVAWLRVLAYGLVFLLDVTLTFSGERSVADALTSTGILAVCVGVLVLVHRLPYFRATAFLMAVLDAFLIWWLIAPRLVERGPTVGLVAVGALSCGLLAATGAIRFSRTAGLWTTGVGAILLWVILTPYVTPSQLLYAACALVSLGLLNVWLTDLVRRSMEGARGRVLLARFLPPSLVSRAFEAPADLLTEPREVEATVLITDLRGFTTLAERRSPNEVLALLNRVHGALAERVEAHGGTVDKFLGDGMLAVFGAPDPVPDHAARALDCAKAILEAVDALGAEDAETPLRVGIGVHSGPLVAGCIGSGARLEFTVIGDTVNVAARLEALTKEMGVALLASEHTVAAAGAGGLVSRGEVDVRGRGGRLGVYTLPAAPGREAA